MVDDKKRPRQAKPSEAGSDWAVAASILGLTWVLARFPADVEIGFNRARGLRNLLVPRAPGEQEGRKP